MLAGQVHAIFVLVAAYHTSIRVGSLTHQGHLDLADVRLVRTDLEHGLVLDLEQL